VHGVLKRERCRLSTQKATCCGSGKELARLSPLLLEVTEDRSGRVTAGRS